MTENFQKTTQPLRCLIVDDEPVAIRGITNFVNKIDFLEVANTCTSAMKASELLKEQEIDLMFLDINMPMLSGLEFLETLTNPPLTIFTTAYSEHALEGYRLNVIDYLLKPIDFQRFFQAVNKALDAFQKREAYITQKNNQDDMYIRQGDAYQRIVWQDILFVEGMQNYQKLHFKDKTLIIHQTMTSLEEMLPSDYFFRTHISYLVNISHIESISGGRISIAGNQVPLSRHRKEELLNTIVYKNLLSK